MSVLERIDSLLRLVAMARGKARKLGRPPSSVGIDELLDARLEWCRTSLGEESDTYHRPRDGQRWHEWLPGQDLSVKNLDTQPDWRYAPERSSG
jgi:hypothetical protein